MATDLISTEQALDAPRPHADARIPYGDNPLQFGDLRLPPGSGPHPVALVIHGGCWLAEYDLGYMAAGADALRSAGIATWSVEYRRIGDEGGGWPGTFVDVAAATDHLRRLADRYELDLDRVVAVGHSAGGHLALWLAGRHGLADGDPLRGDDPLPLAGVVALAGIADLADYASPTGCGAAVETLLGGSPEEVPDRYRRASPAEMLPLGTPQTLVSGVRDPIVPPAHLETYAERARMAGDSVDLVRIAGAGHFELVTPGTEAWPLVAAAVAGMVDAEAPASGGPAAPSPADR